MQIFSICARRNQWRVFTSERDSRYNSSPASKISSCIGEIIWTSTTARYIPILCVFKTMNYERRSPQLSISQNSACYENCSRTKNGKGIWKFVYSFFIVFENINRVLFLTTNGSANASTNWRRKERGKKNVENFLYLIHPIKISIFFSFRNFLFFDF